MTLPLGFDTVIGREPPAEVLWPDPMISRRHLRLLHDEGGVWVEDLGSTNGTYVNGEQVTVRRRLLDGDELRAGQSVATLWGSRSAPVPSDDGSGAQPPGACPDCGTRNPADLWFCTRCGREQRRIPVPLPPQGADHTDALRRQLMTPDGGLHPGAFRQAMRAGNGGHRVQYSEGLALQTILFRLLVLGVVCAALTVLIVPR